MAIELLPDEYKSLLQETVCLYSTQTRIQIKKLLTDDGKILVGTKRKKTGNGKYPWDCSTLEEAIRVTTNDDELLPFYEYFEYTKCYKYSLPLFFEWITADSQEDMNLHTHLRTLCEQAKIQKFDKDEAFKIPTFVADDVKKCLPSFMVEGDYLLIKFVLQKTLANPHDGETITFRYPFILSLNTKNHFLEIRFDGIKYGEEAHRDFVKPFIDYLMRWMQDVLQVKLFNVKQDDILDKIKNDHSGKAVIYKQLMEMPSGGSAELTASDDRDYILPFVGEIRELMEENSDLFASAPEIKVLLEEYLRDKELTANYPYIYVRWLDAIKTKEFVVKLVFDYYDAKFIQLHHMQCAGRLMKERMDYAIEYLYESGSFTKGAPI